MRVYAVGEVLLIIFICQRRRRMDPLFPLK